MAKNLVAKSKSKVGGWKVDLKGTTRRQIWETIEVPDTDDEGNVVHKRIKVLFRIPNADELEEFLGNVTDENEGRSESEVAYEKMVVFVLDWKGINDMDGNAIPFSDETLKALANHIEFSRPVMSRFFMLLSHEGGYITKKAQKKNLGR